MLHHFCVQYRVLSVQSKEDYKEGGTKMHSEMCLVHVRRLPSHPNEVTNEQFQNNKGTLCV